MRIMLGRRRAIQLCLLVAGSVTLVDLVGLEPISWTPPGHHSVWAAEPPSYKSQLQHGAPELSALVAGLPVSPPSDTPSNEPVNVGEMQPTAVPLQDLDSTSVYQPPYEHALLFGSSRRPGLASNKGCRPCDFEYLCAQRSLRQGQWGRIQGTYWIEMIEKYCDPVPGAQAHRARYYEKVFQ